MGQRTIKEVVEVENYEFFCDSCGKSDKHRHFFTDYYHDDSQEWKLICPSCRYRYGGGVEEKLQLITEELGGELIKLASADCAFVTVEDTEDLVVDILFDSRTGELVGVAIEEIDLDAVSSNYVAVEGVPKASLSRLTRILTDLKGRGFF